MNKILLTTSFVTIHLAQTPFKREFLNKTELNNVINSNHVSSTIGLIFIFLGILFFKFKIQSKQKWLATQLSLVLFTTTIGCCSFIQNNGIWLITLTCLNFLLFLHSTILINLTNFQNNFFELYHGSGLFVAIISCLCRFIPIKFSTATFYFLFSFLFLISSILLKFLTKEEVVENSIDLFDTMIKFKKSIGAFSLNTTASFCFFPLFYFSMQSKFLHEWFSPIFSVIFHSCVLCGFFSCVEKTKISNEKWILILSIVNSICFVLFNLFSERMKLRNEKALFTSVNIVFFGLYGFLTRSCLEIFKNISFNRILLACFIFSQLIGLQFSTTTVYLLLIF